MMRVATVTRKATAIATINARMTTGTPLYLRPVCRQTATARHSPRGLCYTRPPMNWTPSVRDRRTLFVIAALLILAIICRGLWSAEQGAHAAAPTLSPVGVTAEHGHSQGDWPDHRHAPEAKLSDVAHVLLHVLSAMESHMTGLMPASQAHLAKSPLLALTIPAPSERQPSQLFRPPKLARTP